MISPRNMTLSTRMNGLKPRINVTTTEISPGQSKHPSIVVQVPGLLIVEIGTTRDPIGLVRGITVVALVLSTPQADACLAKIEGM